MKRADEKEPVVYIVDDDPEFSESVRWLLEPVGLKVELFASADDYLSSVDSTAVGCLVTDLRMPKMSGLELQRALKERGIEMPVIVMTAHGDIDTAVQAMKDGAADFIQKPFNDQIFLDLVNKAIAQSKEYARSNEQRANLASRFKTLSPRERDVLDLVVEGRTNKSIANSLDVSEKTVEAHRANVMQKTKAKSLAELIKMSIAANGYSGKP